MLHEQNMHINLKEFEILGFDQSRLSQNGHIPVCASRSDSDQNMTRNHVQIQPLTTSDRQTNAPREVVLISGHGKGYRHLATSGGVCDKFCGP